MSVPSDLKRKERAIRRLRMALEADEKNSMPTAELLELYTLANSVLQRKDVAERERILAQRLEQEIKARDVKLLEGVPPACQEAIMRDMVDSSANARCSFDDIVGSFEAKQSLREAVILPLLRPDLFRGLRAPPRGILLLGPPGTGKTSLARAVCGESKAKFFNVHASTLTQKYLGESEKMVRALFAVATVSAPSVVFFDECDSILGVRGDDDNPAMLRLKNEMLGLMDGLSAAPGVFCLGATNRPQSLDEAALRRLGKHVHIALPEAPGRVAMLEKLLEQVEHSLDSAQIEAFARNELQRFSGSDINTLVSEAARLPLRELTAAELLTVDAFDIRPLSLADLQVARTKIHPTASLKTLTDLDAWAQSHACV